MSSGRSDLIDVAGVLKHATDKAYLVDFGSASGEAVWVPKSQVEFDGDNTFTMPEWLAMERGSV